MKKIILVASLLMFLLSIITTGYAQTSVIIKGRVIDQITKEALAFVNVVEIDKNGRFVTGTVTDINGNYVLKVRDDQNAIQASFIGFKKQTFTINNRTQIDVILESESQSLEEIKVEAKRIANDGFTQVRDRATAVTQMEFKEMKAVMTTTVEEMMQGRMGNVDITSISGDPGAGMNIRIRGNSSLNARNNPLIVINGIPYDAQIDDNFDFGSADVEKFGSLIDVSPEDIESIEVLKDAASTASWGSKASNGVLMIRTKRGIKSKPVFEYTFKTTVGKEPDPVPMLDGAGYARLITEAHYNVDRNAWSHPEVAFDPTNKELYHNFSQNTNWVKEITQLGFTNQHNFSIRGGGEKSRYNMSADVSDEGGTTIGNRMKKLNLRSSLDYNLSTKLQFKTDIMYTRYDQDATYDVEEFRPERLLRSMAYRKMPNMSVYVRDTLGNAYDEYFTPMETMQGDAWNYYNPVAFAKLGVHHKLKDNARALFNIRYTITPELIFNSTVTLDIFDSKTTKFLPYKAIGTFYGSDNTNKGVNEFSKKSSIYTINQLVYNPKLAENHELTLMGQFDTEETVNRWYKVETSQSASPDIQQPIGNKHLVWFGDSYSEYRSMGLYLTGTYKFRDKYIVTVGAKAEGNSKFSRESRWGIFPTVALAWRISDEPFLVFADFIDELKIRGSWGQTGNAPSDNYLYFNTYSAGSGYSYLDMPGVKPNGVELTSLKWETIDQINGGFSFFGFDNKLNIEFDIYKKRTLDLYLKDSKIPTSSGFGTINLNDGEMENNGLELSIDYTIIKRKDWQLNVNFNVSRNENVVVRLPANYSLEYGDMLKNGNYKISIEPGRPIGGFFGYDFNGVYIDDADAIVRDANGQPVYNIGSEEPMRMIMGGTTPYTFEGGDSRYVDQNHDGQIDELDLVYLGDLNPDFMGGAGFRLQYKDFIVNAFFYSKVGQKIINQTRMDTENMSGNDNQSTATNWRWRREGDITDMPRAYFESGKFVTFNWLGSDRFVEDGSYLRLKTLSFSYLVDKRFCKLIKVNDMKLFATAYNLFTWTNYSGQDPDVAPPSRPDELPKDYSRTPPSRRIMLGLNISF
jgi:TonB-linked SusC/RagA family outer membrane protein